jgi:hypothetical protein
LPSGQPTPLEPPSQPLTGDSHAHLIAPAIAFAESLGYSVTFEPVPGSPGGWCDSKHNKIVVDSDVAPNARLRTLVHEAIHALGVDYQHYPGRRPKSSSTPRPWSCSAASAWTSPARPSPTSPAGARTALDTVTQFAALIDTLPRRVKAALSGARDGTQETLAVA